MPVRAERSMHVIFLNRIVFVTETKIEAVSQAMLRTASMCVCTRRMGRRRGAVAVVAMGSAERMIELLARGLRGAGLPYFGADGKRRKTDAFSRARVRRFCIFPFTPSPMCRNWVCHS